MNSQAKPTQPVIINGFAAAIMLCVGAAIAMAWWRYQSFSFFAYDDMYIVLRYAANALHHGVVHWNVGEAVEGYTNPLHLGLIIGLGGLGFDLVDAARVINAAAWLGSAIFLYIIFRPRIGVWLAALPAIIVLANPALIVWVWGGLEAPLSVFLLLAAQFTMLGVLTDTTKNTNKYAVLSGFLFALAALNRLDTALFACVAGGAWVVVNRFHLLRPFLFAMAFGVPLALHAVWRWYIYGDILPNTFYAKVTGTLSATLANGIDYLIDAFTAPPFLYLGGIAALVFLLNGKYRSFAIYAFISIFLSAIYIAKIGGDFMPAFRFLIPWLPLLTLAYGLVLAEVKEKFPENIQKTAILSCAALLALFCVLPQNMRSLDASGPLGIKVGDYMHAQWPAGSLIAVNAAGAIPYENLDKNFIDMLGLNDKHIAKRVMPDVGASWQKKVGHSKGDGAYVLSRQPDYIILGSIAGDVADDTPVFASDVELKALPEFKKCYKNYRIMLPWPESLAARIKGRGDHFTFSYYQRVCKKRPA